MGDETRISMWQRARALVFLFVMVVVLGAAVAGFIGLIGFIGMLVIDLLAA